MASITLPEPACGAIADAGRPAAATLVMATGAAIAGLMIVARLTGTSVGGGLAQDKRGRWKGWFKLGRDKP